MDIPVGTLLLDTTNWRFQDTPRTRRLQTRHGTYKDGIRSDVFEGGVREKCQFTVPLGTLKERLDLVCWKYQRKFGKYLEGKGFVVHSMSDPVLDLRPLPVAPDRTRYLLFAWCSRRPQQVVIKVADQYVPEMLKLGLKLVE